jgi:hypothetical protein
MYAHTHGGGDGSDGFLSELRQTGGKSSDHFSAISTTAATFEATALAAAAEATVESVVATAEAPADAGGGTIVRTTAPYPERYYTLSRRAQKNWRHRNRRK